MNKDKKKYLNKIFVFFIIKDFIFYKYICKMYKLQNIMVSKKCDRQTDRHTDKHRDKAIHRGAPLLKMYFNVLDVIYLKQLKGT